MTRADKADIAARLGFVVIVLAIAISVVGRTPISAAPTTNLEPRVSALESQVANLTARVSSLEARLPSPTPAPTASPSPSPSLSPSPSPSSSPSPSPSPSTGTDPWAVPFATRPASGPINLSGTACQGITIRNLTFANLGPGVRAITLTNCSNVTIAEVDFLNVAEGVIAHGGSNITVRDARYQNIIGPAHDASGNRTVNLANFVQFDNVAGGAVTHNKGRCGDTEDIVSLTGSTHDVVAQGNQFEGMLVDSTGCLAWKSNSGSGIAVADGSGTRNSAIGNTVLNPGQVGIFISGGTSSHIDQNVIVGQTRPLSNVGAYISSGAGAACADTFIGNRVNWSRSDGMANPYYDAPDGCSPDETGSTPEGGRDTTLDPNAYHVQL